MINNDEYIDRLVVKYVIMQKEIPLMMNILIG